MRVVAIIQARMTAERLPAKVMLDLGGTTALARCVARVQRIEGVAEVVVATSETSPDDVLARHATKLGVRVSRGSLGDVLARYGGAAKEANADAIVRITADCPLLDPSESALVVRAFRTATMGAEPCAYAANILERRYPRGLDTEIFHREALERALRDAHEPAEREHVTMHFYRNRNKFHCLSVIPRENIDLSGHRWTLDTLDDYCFLSALFHRLGDRAATAGWLEVASIVESDPQLRTLNQHVVQKTS